MVSLVQFTADVNFLFPRPLSGEVAVELQFSNRHQYYLAPAHPAVPESTDLDEISSEKNYFPPPTTM